MFAYRATIEGDLGSIEVAFTNSDSDLGDMQGASVREPALQSLAQTVDARIQVMAQVHGNRVSFVGFTPTGTPPEADGLVTRQLGVALTVRVADCVPVLLADPESRIVGAAHAGRVGLAAGIVAATVEELRDRGADQLLAWVGPHICGACYEVPEQMRENIAAVVPSTYATSRWGTPALDIGAGVVAQLAESGCDVTVVPGCTLEDRRFHSFRRDGDASGRMAGLVWMTP